MKQKLGTSVMVWIGIQTLCILWVVPRAMAQSVQTSVFHDDFQVMWADDHVQTSPDGRVWQLSLDQASGSGFQSKNRYKYGWFSMRLKLVPGDSAGVVTAYYMSSNTDNRDELDFEFLGNRSGQPYILQTNMYINGVGNREQRTFLWFDPTHKFHYYSILWNPHQVVFYVDEVPIRVHRNTPMTRAVFPATQPMYIASSIWNADNWATRGGLEKINWNAAPFISAYEKFHMNGCMWKDASRPCETETVTNHWWNEQSVWSIPEQQRANYTWARKNFLVYDYCKDEARFPTLPVECNVGAW